MSGVYVATVRGGAFAKRVVRKRDVALVLVVFGVLMVIPARLAASDVRDFAALRGQVSVLSVRGPSDSRPFPIWVWRPPGPDSASIPVVYFLHGYPGNALNCGTAGMAALLDTRLRDGYPPFVLACPDGNGSVHSDTEWANADNGTDQVMSRVTGADIAAVEGTHRRPPALRVIAGFSMGGYGAMNIAMQNPGLYGSVVSISGYFVTNDLSDMFGGIPAVLARNDPSAHPAAARGMNVILEEDADDPLTLVRGQAAWMAGLLQQAGVPAVLRVMPGSHSWAYAKRAFTDALTYLEQYWQQYAAREAA
jgi:S-formylglutathione hydrolase FrmB